MKQRRKGQRFALILAAFLTPAAVSAFGLACWGFAAKFNWASSFAIPNGPLSYWQVWLAAAVALQVCSHYLGRSGREDRQA